MKDLIIIEEKNNKAEFLVKLSQEIAHVVKIYCDTIEINPEQFIRDAIVKGLIQTYVDLQSEEYIYVGDKFPEVKKPLKKFFEVSRLMIEHNSK
ncbi:hypothetical protein LCGC14_1076800 [marine sediment metagenome]|uniref:Uncharacterized protein n=1 Tax=marine sediment metagenome TaxID=412755 RepID=A0A0F9QMB5_9ZZZZ